MTRRNCYATGLVVAVMGVVAPAQAEITISGSPTANMSCSQGVCSPTAATANLNTSDLEYDLAAGNLEVTTTGSGVQAGDIVIEAGFSWSAASALTFDAYHSVTFQSAVTVDGSGAVSLVTNDGGSGGTLSFISGGSLSFTGTTNALSIDGKSYTLAGSLAALASDIAADHTGHFALAASYDAGQDGRYKRAPIGNKFKGTFNGLGNTISNLSIHAVSKTGEKLGLFAYVDTSGTIASIRVIDATIKAPPNSVTGVIAGLNAGTIFNSSASGSINGKSGKEFGGAYGGLVGSNEGTLNETAASTNISVSGSDSTFAYAGGLAGGNSGNINMSYATGDLIAVRGVSGGLVGFSGGNGSIKNIDNCYATGAASVGASTGAGGLIGGNAWTISNSYSTGAPTSTGAPVGGSIGFDESQAGSLSNVYWDTTSSGITNLSQGAGNVANDPGITGETTAQLQAGLPTGFDPSIWAEGTNINGGLPYLIANPPQ